MLSHYHQVLHGDAQLIGRNAGKQCTFLYGQRDSISKSDTMHYDLKQGLQQHHSWQNQLKSSDAIDYPTVEAHTRAADIVCRQWNTTQYSTMFFARRKA